MRKSEAVWLFGGSIKLLSDVLQLKPGAIYMWPYRLPIKTECQVIGAAVKCGLLKIRKSNNYDLLHKAGFKAKNDETGQVEAARRRDQISEFLRRDKA